jgi:hypothetical protein
LGLPPKAISFENSIMQKEYRGQRTPQGTLVMVDGRPLNPRLDLYNHSPDGFEWGYSGSGPAQLALAILADHFGHDQLALANYQAFKFAVRAGIEADQWTLTSADVSGALQKIFDRDLAGPA